MTQKLSWAELYPTICSPLVESVVDLMAVKVVWAAMWKQGTVLRTIRFALTIILHACGSAIQNCHPEISST